MSNVSYLETSPMTRHPVELQIEKADLAINREDLTR